MRARRRMFTLTELITVLVVVALLAGIALVGYQRVVDSTRDRAREVALASIVREAQALVAFAGATPTQADWQAALATAAGESNADAASDGDLAAQTAAGWDTPAYDATGTAAPATLTSLVWSDHGTGGVHLRALTRSGNVAHARIDAPAGAIETWSGAAPPTTTTTSTAPPPQVTSLTMTSPGDTNGLFYWLGSAGKTTSYTNPAVGGVVTANVSSYIDTNRVAAAATDRGSVGWHSGNENGAWIRWDLGPTQALQVASYTLKSRDDAGDRQPRNWIVEGSNDAGATWTTIDSRTNDTTITASPQWGAFTPSSPPAAGFRYLRVRSTGADSSSGGYFLLGEVEFYGQLTTTPLTALAGSTPLRFASFGDTNGVFHHLGTVANTTSWTNPATTGQITITPSSYVDTWRVPSMLTDRTTTPWHSGNEANAWIKVDLGNRRALRPVSYTLSSRGDSDSRIPRSWVVEGSNDGGATWTVLDARTADTTIVTAPGWGSFWMPPTSSTYHQFRVRYTGRDSDWNSADYMVLGELEMYGDLVDTTPAALAGTTALPYTAGSTPGGTGGLFWWLGTAGGTQPFSNPATSGAVTVAASSYYDGARVPANLTDRGTAVWGSGNENGAWVRWDLGAARMRVLHYTLKSRDDASDRMPRNWVVEGSNDATTWTTIDARSNDQTVTSSPSWGSFSVTDPTAATWRYLRLRSTGGDSTSGGYFFVGEIEFYGELQ